MSFVKLTDAAQKILDTGDFFGFVIDYMKEIDGKFECRLKVEYVSRKYRFTYYPAENKRCDTKLEAVESCLLHAISTGCLPQISKSDTLDEPTKPGRGRKKKSVNDEEVKPDEEVKETPEI